MRSASSLDRFPECPLMSKSIWSFLKLVYRSFIIFILWLQKFIPPVSYLTYIFSSFIFSARFCIILVNFLFFSLRLVFSVLYFSKIFWYSSWYTSDFYISIFYLFVKFLVILSTSWLITLMKVFQIFFMKLAFSSHSILRCSKNISR